VRQKVGGGKAATKKRRGTGLDTRECVGSNAAR
jgi:hypothetical protein